jgi:hypothetical protein
LLIGEREREIIKYLKERVGDMERESASDRERERYLVNFVLKLIRVCVNVDQKCLTIHPKLFQRPKRLFKFKANTYRAPLLLYR